MVVGVSRSHAHLLPSVVEGGTGNSQGRARDKRWSRVLMTLIIA